MPPLVEDISTFGPCSLGPETLGIKSIEETMRVNRGQSSDTPISTNSREEERRGDKANQQAACVPVHLFMCRKIVGKRSPQATRNC